MGISSWTGLRISLWLQANMESVFAKTDFKVVQKLEKLDDARRDRIQR